MVQVVQGVQAGPAGRVDQVHRVNRGVQVAQPVRGGQGGPVVQGSAPRRESRLGEQFASLSQCSAQENRTRWQVDGGLILIHGV